MATVVRSHEVPPERVEEDGACGLDFRQLFGPAAGRKLNVNLASVRPGGVTRAHRHEWEQVNYILAGQGVLVTPTGRHRVEAGTAVHIPGGEQHQYENTGSEALEILGVLGPILPAPVEGQVESYLVSEVTEMEVTGGAMARRLPVPSWAQGPSVRLVRIDPGREVAPHIHERELEFILVQEGTGRVRVGDREITCEPGRVVVVPPGVVHGFVNEGTATCRVIGIVVAPVAFPG